MGRGSCLVTLGLCAAFASAQKAVEIDQLIRFAAPLTITQEKYVHEGIQGLEAGAQVWVDRPNAEAKVRAHIVLDRQALEGAWTTQGMQIIYIGPMVVGETTERSHPAGSPAGFPVYIDTGDPAADNAAYEEAKAAWLAAHQKGAADPIDQPE